jgi:hypothetical protein
MTEFQTCFSRPECFPFASKASLQSETSKKTAIGFSRTILAVDHFEANTEFPEGFNRNFLKTSSSFFYFSRGPSPVTIAERVVNARRVEVSLNHIRLLVSSV